MSSRALRQLASWIALLAVVTVTFMPSLTSLWSGDPVGIQVCSADAGHASAPGEPRHGIDHCPYCALHADLAPPLPPKADGVTVAVLFRELPPAFLAAPRASLAWSTAQSRAPPVIV